MTEILAFIPRLSWHTEEMDMGGSTQTFDWSFFAIVVPLPFLAALELLKTRFISERNTGAQE